VNASAAILEAREIYIHTLLTAFLARVRCICTALYCGQKKVEDP
jgi:hypothetical protein